MAFKEVLKIYFQKYGIFYGRACRSEFWYSLFICISFVVLWYVIYYYSIFGNYLKLSRSSRYGNFPTFILLVMPAISAVFRRFQDRGRHGVVFILSTACIFLFVVFGGLRPAIWISAGVV
ncbi:MAG: DUF805 domain-containing protein [Mailhella sp.]|nr:DUF805 domain-containing protein [Mailhella sp.]